MKVGAGRLLARFLRRELDRRNARVEEIRQAIVQHKNVIVDLEDELEAIEMEIASFQNVKKWSEIQAGAAIADADSYADLAN